MTAMDAANNKCGRYDKGIVTMYNRARQAAITQEITEVVGGANALKTQNLNAKALWHKVSANLQLKGVSLMEKGKIVQVLGLYWYVELDSKYKAANDKGTPLR